MLSREDNEAITRVGPGTVMGNFLREYWIPACLSTELPHPDCDPLRVMLLGEPLIGFRDTSGRPGLIQNLCPHRGSSLFLGRNEEGGIRCLYHGWKFDVEGNCTDMPNEPPESNFKDKVRGTAYPCVERGGLVWAYMGSRETPPSLPSVEATMLPEGEYLASATMRACNWLQALEGDIDTVHAVILHGGAREPEWSAEGSYAYYELNQRAPHFASVDTPYGAIYGAYRPGPPGQNYWRIGTFSFPFWTSPGGSVLGHKIASEAWVPMDDTHTMIFATRSVTRGALSPMTGLPVATAGKPSPEVKPNTTDWYGRFVTVYGPENDFMIDREEQRELGSYSGMPFGNGPEDSAVQVYMEAILDRSIEHLGTSDLMIIRVRQRLLEAARAFAEHKIAPPALDDPDCYGVRAGGAFIPIDADWLDYTEELRKAFVDHPDLDLEVVGDTIPKGRRHTRTRGL